MNKSITLLASNKDGLEYWLDENGIVWLESPLAKNLGIIEFEEFYKNRAQIALRYKMVPTEFLKNIIREREENPMAFHDFPLAQKWNHKNDKR